MVGAATPPAPDHHDHRRNDPPVAVNDGVLVTNEDTALNNINVAGNDSGWMGIR